MVPSEITNMKASKLHLFILVLQQKMAEREKQNLLW